MALIGDDLSPNIAGNNSIATQLKAGGFDVIYNKNPIPGAPAVVTDFTPYVEDVMTADKGKPPDVVVIVSGPTNLFPLVAGLDEPGYKGLINHQTYAPQIVGPAKGTTATNTFATAESTTPTMLSIVSTLHAAGVSVIGAPELTAYLSADYFIQLLKKVGRPDLTPQRFQQAASNFTYQIPGVIGPAYYQRASRPVPRVVSWWPATARCGPSPCRMAAPPRTSRRSTATTCRCPIRAASPDGQADPEDIRTRPGPEGPASLPSTAYGLGAGDRQPFGWTIIRGGPQGFSGQIDRLRNAVQPDDHTDARPGIEPSGDNGVEGAIPGLATWATPNWIMTPFWVAAVTFRVSPVYQPPAAKIQRSHGHASTIPSSSPAVPTHSKITGGDEAPPSAATSCHTSYGESDDGFTAMHGPNLPASSSRSALKSETMIGLDPPSMPGRPPPTDRSLRPR